MNEHVIKTKPRNMILHELFLFIHITHLFDTLFLCIHCDTYIRNQQLCHGMYLHFDKVY